MSQPDGGEEILRKRVALTVRAARLRKGATQVQLATAAGLDTRHVQKIEAGESNVTLRTLARLASALDVDARELLGNA